MKRSDDDILIPALILTGALLVAAALFVFVAYVISP